MDVPVVVHQVVPDLSGLILGVSSRVRMGKCMVGDPYATVVVPCIRFHMDISVLEDGENNHMGIDGSVCRLVAEAKVVAVLDFME
jgi:hypothetical protein